jgi:hypothetical protein
MLADFFNVISRDETTVQQKESSVITVNLLIFQIIIRTIPYLAEGAIANRRMKMEIKWL